MKDRSHILLPRRRRFVAAAIAGMGLLASALPALADRTEPLPKQLEGVGVTDRRNAQIPLQLEFKDEDGQVVTLADYF